MEEVVAARVPTDVAERLRASARQADRSMSAEIRRALREWVEREGAANPAGDRTL